MLEEVFQKLSTNQRDRGIVVGEQRLTNFLLADDIVLFSSSVDELSQILEQLRHASSEVRFQMNNEDQVNDR